MTVPLRQREGQQSEFKSKDALKDLATIAREVVAMLNATGGKLWIGVREENHIAVQLESIPDLETEIRRLRDHLIDTVEPSPTKGEVEINPVHGSVIRVDIRPDEDRKPYAYVRSSGRLFVTRIEDRLRPLTREELFNRTASREELRRDGAARQVEEDLERAIKLLGGRNRELLWLRFQPIGGTELRFQPLLESELLVDPEQSEVTDLRATFLNAHRHSRRDPALRKSRWLGEVRHLAVGEEGAYWFGARRDGGLLLTVPLPWHGIELFVPPGERLLSPFDLLEYPISMFRLVRTLTAGPALWTTPERLPFDWLVRLALFGLRGWTLRPGIPLTAGFTRAYKPPCYDGEDPFLTQPLFFAARELELEPDRCAFRLLARVYEDAFGLLEDDIPRQFDRKSGRYISDRL